MVEGGVKENEIEHGGGLCALRARASDDELAFVVGKGVMAVEVHDMWFAERGIKMGGRGEDVEGTVAPELSGIAREFGVTETGVGNEAVDTASRGREEALVVEKEPAGGVFSADRAGEGGVRRDFVIVVELLVGTTSEVGARGAAGSGNTLETTNGETGLGVEKCTGVAVVADFPFSK
jgi:hypothetical protein